MRRWPRRSTAFPASWSDAGLDARVDAHTVKLYWRGELIKVHPVMAPGCRHTDPADLSAEVLADAMRDLNTLQRKASAHGDHVGAYAAAVLEHPLPWTKKRQVYRLLGLVRRHGADAVDDACRRALYTEAIDVGFIDHMCSPPTASSYRSCRHRQRRHGSSAPAPISPSEGLADAYNVLIMGPVGVGKTLLANALGHIAVRRHHSVHTERADKLFKRLRAAAAGRHLRRRDAQTAPRRAVHHRFIPTPQLFRSVNGRMQVLFGTLHVWREAGTQGRCNSGTARDLLSWEQGAPARGGTMPTIAWTCSDGPPVGSLAA